MKNALVVLALSTCFALPLAAQSIPNAGFEMWMDGNPIGWWTDNIPGLFEPVVQTSNAHEGSSAAIGTVLDFSGNPYIPILAAGSDATGFPINFRPEALHGWYMFESDSGDDFSVTFALMNNQMGIGAGTFYSPVVRSVYTEFVANVFYYLPDIPDSAGILFLIASSSQAHIGSSFTVDDLSFGPATGVDEEPLPGRDFILEQNFPNPFNPSTLIPFQIEQDGFVSLRVYNLLGQEIAVLVNERMDAGKYRAEFDASDLPGGMYIYRLEGGARSESRKMILLK